MHTFHIPPPSSAVDLLSDLPVIRLRRARRKGSRTKDRCRIQYNTIIRRRRTLRVKHFTAIRQTIYGVLTRKLWRRCGLEGVGRGCSIIRHQCSRAVGSAQTSRVQQSFYIYT